VERIEKKIIKRFKKQETRNNNQIMTNQKEITKHQETRYKQSPMNKIQSPNEFLVLIKEENKIKD